MGNTCFMSVVLQCLLHNPYVRAHFHSDGHNSNNCEKEFCVACALDEIFTEFYSTEKTEGYGAVNMLMNTWKTAATTNSGLAGYDQQDAHEYMQFMLNTLHSNHAKGSVPDDECRCVIHQTFYGRLQSSMTCGHCKTRNLSVEPFLDLSLDIPSEGHKKPSKEEKPLRLEKCLERFIKGENLSYGCRTCNSQRTGTKQFTLKRLPHVLCIHLKVSTSLIYQTNLWAN
jgi:ubiquitin carboxyl-terminal hydrolase 22/27/51